MSYIMQSYNTRPNPNTEYGSIQSEAEETHATHEPSVSKKERERFRPNSVGQSKERREEKITNDNDTFHYIIARIKE